MGYVEESLSSGEQIVMKARLHWGMIINPVISILTGMLFVAIGLILIKSPEWIMGLLPESLSPAIEDIPVLILAVSCVAGGWLGIFLVVLRMLGSIATFLSTEFAVTNKRVIGKSGALRRRSLEIMLSKIESVRVDEPLWGRILNYGTIVVKGSGGTSQSFPFISDAMALRRQINNLIPPSER